MTTPQRRSRLSGLYRQTVEERQHAVSEHTGVSAAALSRLAETGGLDVKQADAMIENVIGLYALPLAVAPNFIVNDRDVLVPMVIEESSVVAAAANAARLVRDGGGFSAECDAPLMIAQLQLHGDHVRAEVALRAKKNDILARADQSQLGLVGRGGGARDLEFRAVGQSLVMHLIVDCRDAMGANLVNTMAEAIAPMVAEIGQVRVGLRILSNLADKRLCRARARVPAASLDTETLPGLIVRDRIVEASQFAEADPYRAATHNKGVMNGVDAVALATGQDWRGIEAGAHAFAARRGRYEPLSTWRVANDGALEGVVEMPMAVGSVGGAVNAHSAAQQAMAILGRPNAKQLAEVMVSVGLASNLAALRVLATEGIQRGHMRLHRRRVQEQT